MKQQQHFSDKRAGLLGSMRSTLHACPAVICALQAHCAKPLQATASPRGGRSPAGTVQHLLAKDSIKYQKFPLDSAHRTCRMSHRNQKKQEQFWGLASYYRELVPMLF